MESEGYEPVTDVYLGYFDGYTCYPLAGGVNESQEKASCFFTVNGKVATLDVDDNRIAQDAAISEYDEQAFIQLHGEEVGQVYFVQTSLQGLRNEYVGKQIDN